METRRDGNGGETFLEHWGFTVLVSLTALAGPVFLFVLNLRGTWWTVFFGASFVFMASGGVLIGWAKFPVYRSRRWFTFGAKSVPMHLAGYYRWGWRVFLFGLVLGLCLLLSRA